MEVVVGRIGRAHGVRGEVSVEIRTDEPTQRFAVGQRLATDGSKPAATPQALTVARARSHRGGLVVAFEEVTDRDAAEQLRGVLLVTEVDDADVVGSPDEFYDWQLIGLRVFNRGASIGEVTEVRHSPGQELLVVTSSGLSSEDTSGSTSASEVLIPFVAAMVLDVDLDAQTIATDLPDGLLELTQES